MICHSFMCSRITDWVLTGASAGWARRAAGTRPGVETNKMPPVVTTLGRKQKDSQVPQEVSVNPGGRELSGRGRRCCGDTRQ